MTEFWGNVFVWLRIKCNTAELLLRDVESEVARKARNFLTSVQLKFELVAPVAIPFYSCRDCSQHARCRYTINRSIWLSKTSFFLLEYLYMFNSWSWVLAMLELIPIPMCEYCILKVVFFLRCDFPPPVPFRKKQCYSLGLSHVILWLITEFVNYL